MLPENQRAEGDQALAGVEGGESARRAQPGSLLTLGKKRRREGDRLRGASLRAEEARLDLGPTVLGPAEADLPVTERGVRRERFLRGGRVVPLAFDAARMARWICEVEVSSIAMSMSS